MIEGEPNDIIIGIILTIVVIFVVTLGVEVTNPTYEQLPIIEETSDDMLSAVFTKDVIAILVSLVIVAIMAIIIYIARMYQGWSFGDK